MIEKLTFAFEQYSLLGLFVLSTYGWGYLLTRWIPVSSQISPGLIIPIRLASGIGVLMAGLVPIASLGLLKISSILVLLFTGIVINIWGWREHSPVWKRWIPGCPGADKWPWIGLLTAVALPLLVKPLLPPLNWDELAFHLPYAHFWAEQGSLLVNPWLRFPLMPFNMQLLYSATLVAGNDVLPHLLNALTAALTLALTFAVGRRYMDWKTGVIAVLLLAFSTRPGWSTADVDFPVMLFWTCAFVALTLRHESGDVRFMFLAALFAGLAIGVKYQALLYVPVFSILVLRLEQRLPVLAKTALVFLLVGSFWYVRNFIVSGNPVHPVAGSWFGYWIWNAEDLANLNEDLDRVRDWPPVYFICSAGALVFWRGAAKMQQAVMLVAAISTGIWAVSSAYPRYLMAIYPMLALLSAFLLVSIFRRVSIGKSTGWIWKRMGQRWRTATAAVLVTILLLGGVLDASEVFSEVTPDPESRKALIQSKFGGYALLLSLPEVQTGVIYQLGFEGELYYLGAEVRGDWFGPGRYQDVMSLSTNAPEMVRHLEKLGAESLLISRSRKPFSELNWDPAMQQYFELLGQTPDATLYRLRPPNSR